jgi:hypothetical protein
LFSLSVAALKNSQRNSHTFSVSVCNRKRKKESSLKLSFPASSLFLFAEKPTQRKPTLAVPFSQRASSPLVSRINISSLSLVFCLYFM